MSMPRCRLLMSLWLGLSLLLAGSSVAIRGMRLSFAASRLAAPVPTATSSLGAPAPAAAAEYSAEVNSAMSARANPARSSSAVNASVASR